MTEVITLTNIFDIAENPVSKDEMEKIFADITLKLTLKEKWNIIIGKSYADRYRFIKQVQANNLSYRKKLFEKAETDIDLQLALWEKCSREPCYFINFFLWTYNPKPLDGVYNLLFILYPFQEEFVQKLVSAIEAGEELWIEKSREMGFSWLMCAIGLRGFLFRKWSGLMGSYKQDYVDKQGDKKSLFEKIRYMIGRLPKWMLPSDLIQNFMQISSDIIGCSISGDS
ncbi:MAG: hypothetical protein LBD75_03265 [Candidatus Peribacteria bacterium]|jgi:hypothetical protein|nr:hypothetical protein [Candidatus Peribacteria bacterium]